MEGKTCCITGHRNLPQKEINRVKVTLRCKVDSAIIDGVTYFMCDFADSVDQYFAEIVLEKKKMHLGLELTAVVYYRKGLGSLMEKD